MNILFKSMAMVTVSALALVGCTTTDKRLIKYQKMLNGPADEIILDMDYIDAFANAKHNYDKCVARASFQTPIYVQSMGSTIRTMTTIPGTDIKTDLDRQNKLGVINVEMGDGPLAILHFRPHGDSQTSLKVHQGRKLFAKAHQKELDNAKSFASSRLDRCP